MTIRDAVPAAVAERLSAAGCLAAHDEAAVLTSAAPDEDTLERWIRRREQGAPLAWIIGTTRFCGHTVLVDEGVYVPRSWSESVARTAAQLLPAEGAAVDLCTGAGAIAVHLISEVPTASVIGVDIDERAADCARRNGVHVLRGDLDQPLRSHAFDVVTAVAPYVPTGSLHLLPRDVQRHEPRLALNGGADGLDVIRRIVAGASRVLRPGGWLVIEIGGDQDQELDADLAALGFHRGTSWSDDDGDLRGIAAQARGRTG